VSVTDLTTYNYCKRKLWLLKKARIKRSERDWCLKGKYHALRSITNLIVSETKMHSLSDFLFRTLNEIDGEIVGTEIQLEREGLTGRIDVLRKTQKGYIIQEEKSSNPPNSGVAWESDLIQVDAYAFLAEGSSYSPVIGGIIIYNDLEPRKVKPHPNKAEEILKEVIWLLESPVLPEVEGSSNKCAKCDYYPLCQILPREGGLTGNQIKRAFEIPKEIIRKH
jgi:CRISPR-associated protein Cas4